MIVRIDLNSGEPLYSQLSNQIKYGVAKGYLKPGEALPSVRSLASEIGINLHTVSKAYRMLKDEGIIVINRGKGVKVSEDVLKNRSSSYKAVLEEKILKLISEGICNGIKEEEFIFIVKKTFKNLEDK